MANTQKAKYKFSWGAPVRVIDDAPQKYLVIKKGSVCGIREIEAENVAENFDEPIGTVLYLVEFSSGDAIEVPERFLVDL